jgi:hypothetical protein
MTVFITLLTVFFAIISLAPLLVANSGDDSLIQLPD